MILKLTIHITYYAAFIKAHSPDLSELHRASRITERYNTRRGCCADTSIANARSSTRSSFQLLLLRKP
jgi:hypothetical protein